MQLRSNFFPAKAAYHFTWPTLKFKFTWCFKQCQFLKRNWQYLEMTFELGNCILSFQRSSLKPLTVSNRLLQVSISPPLIQQPYGKPPKVPNHGFPSLSSSHKSQCLSQDDSYNVMIAVIRREGLHFSIFLGIPWLAKVGLVQDSWKYEIYSGLVILNLFFSPYFST